MEEARKTSKGKPADPNLKCDWCGEVLAGVTVDEQYEDYRVHMASRDSGLHRRAGSLPNHNASPGQWANAHEMIEKGKERAKSG